MSSDSDSTNNIKCNRCGKCCYYVLNGVKKKCKFLILLPNGKTLCRIYNKKDRIGTEIDTGIYCNRIEDVIKTGAQFEGCPYNVLFHSQETRKD